MIQKFFEFNSNNDVLLETIKEDYFKSDKVVISNKDGYWIKDGKALVGSTINGKLDIPGGLLHEMGHCVLFKDKSRLLRNYFGLGITTKIEVLGKSYEEPTTWQATKNECRAVIYQAILCDKYNIPYTFERFISAFKYMPDWWNVPVKGYKWVSKEESGKSGYYNEAGEACKYDDQDKYKYLTLMDFINAEKLKPIYTIEHFDKEWFERIKYIEENLV